MKKFTKIMLSVAAVTAVSTAMAISAMADDTVTGTYASETGVVTLDGVVSSGEQQTLLVLTEDAATVTESIIAQIDQDAAISQFVLPASIESGTYYIRIGGTDGTIQTGTLTIGGGSEPGGSTHEVLIGDVDQNGRVTSGDASLVLTLVAGKNTGSLTGDALVAAQKCNGLEDTKVTSADASAVLTYNANKKHDFVNTKIQVAD